MSSSPVPVPVPVTADRTPFVATTTPTIERANRLIGVRSHPGFLDLVRISQDILQEAREHTEDYPGWDPEIVMVLKVRQQTAKDYLERWLQLINKAIDEGVAEARAQVEAANIPAKTAEESVDQGDYVRQRVLETFTEMETRVPGSYDPNPITYEF